LRWTSPTRVEVWATESLDLFITSPHGAAERRDRKILFDKLQFVAYTLSIELPQRG